MTNSAEDELEAVIWDAMRVCRVTTTRPVEFVELLKSAAMDYSAGDSDLLTEMRRRVLHEATRPERIDGPVGAGGGGEAPRRELDPSGSRAQPTEEATLSTGPSISLPGQTSAKNHPQPVDNDLSHRQAGQLLEALHDRQSGKTAKR
jgi:hypothetical protein